MPIVPDDKDWTWVVLRPCTECGFDASSLAPTDVAAGIRDNGGRWRSLLDHPLVAERPSDDRWSALEYACHVRDVYGIYDERLGRMLTEDDPLFANWDQDVSAVDDRYSEQDPAEVVEEIEAGAARLADHFELVGGDQWQRPGRRSDGATFTVESFARYMLHDPVHHAWDVQQGYAALGGSPG